MTKRAFTGFSLIEVIVSSALVATTVGALFAAASMSSRLTILGQERVAASQLAREGLEIAKNIRDQNFINKNCNFSGVQAGTCADWRNGLLTKDDIAKLPDGAITKHVDTTTAGYSFKPADLTTTGSCTDYISRKTMRSDGTLREQPDKIFCRRIFIEPVDDIGVPGTTVDESEHAIRVRSQVAWVGNGRNQLRSFSEGQVDVTNPCGVEDDTEEWCTEQVTILTDWRASND